MALNKERLAYLLRKYIDKNSTSDELKELFDLIGQEENKEILFLLMDEQYKTQQVKPDENRDWDSLYQQLLAKTAAARKSNFHVWFRFAAAAVILIVLGFGAYFWSVKTASTSFTKNKNQIQQKQDIAPGKAQAVLTLANGSTIILDKASNGVLAKQGNTAIAKAGNGELVYHADQQENLNNNTVITTNTISTPRGGKYQVVLSDGSKVWLNAASSLTFPTAFAGKERNVELQGEAYFEVAKNKAMPFLVHTAESTVEVLGTHFNIMSYPDEKIRKTTLLEGSVKISYKSQSQILKPGEQASYEQGRNELNIAEADTDDVIAWKNNLFQFDNASIDEVMQQITRWYDTEVVYEGRKPHTHFTGVIPRNNNVSKVLQLLESAGGVKFKIADKKIVVQ